MSSTITLLHDSLATMEHLSEYCEGLAHPNIFNFALSLFLVFGILGSYLPQHFKLISRRSSEGLSPYFILLGTISSTCAIANVLTLPRSHQDIACCRDISPFACTAGLLGIAQIGVQWSCFFAIMAMFILFFPRDNGQLPNGDDHHSSSTSGGLQNQSSYATAIMVVFTCMVHLLVTLIISVIIFAGFRSRLQTWADFLGIAASVLACIQYLPQIYTTWKLKSAHSLSILMMCFQTPGSAFFVLSLVLRFGAAGWSAWAPYVVTGSLQCVLLILAASFQYRQRRIQSEESNIGSSLERAHHGEETDDEGGPVEPVERPARLPSRSERTPLLQREGSNTSMNRSRVRRSQSARKFSQQSQA